MATKQLRLAGVLALVAEVPLLVTIVGGLAETLTHVDRKSTVANLTFLGVLLCLGPVALVAAIGRMWRPPHPVGLFLVALVISGGLGFLGAGFLALGGAKGELLWFALATLLGVAAGLLALAFAYQQAKARA